MKRRILPIVLSGALSLAAQFPFTRTAESAPDLAPRRPRIAPKVLMYPEVQYKYGLFQNFLDGYIDRPLFFDRATRYKDKFAYSTRESFVRDAEIMRGYGFDGGGNLSNAIYGSYVKAVGFAESAPDRLKGYLQFPQFAFGESGKYSVDFERSARVLRTALAHPEITPKIRGRIPISIYNASYISRDAMRKFIAALRKEFGDTFALVCDIRVSPGDVREFVSTGNWSENTQAKYRRQIDEIMEIFGGIQVRTFEEKRTFDYTFTPESGFYDRYLEPMIMEALARPENRDKIVIGYAQHGYINHMSGVNKGEYGTARVRGIMNRLARMNCDVIVFFEWNEFNENTCWQPTLYNSLVLQRLVRYYADVMRGETPHPNANDDCNIPPLALSFRETLKCGEVLQFELLNIPDTVRSAAYTAKLELRDAGGKLVHTFPEEKFDRAKLEAVTYSVPTEALTGHTVLHPRLTVSGADGNDLVFEGFQYVRLLPTFCYNYKAVRHSLRDMLRPAEVSFTAERTDGNRYRIRGKIRTNGEKLSSLEVTDFGREIFAVDPSNEFDRSKYEIFVGKISTRRSGRRPVMLEVQGTEDWDFREWGFPNVTLSLPKRDGNSVSSDWPVWGSDNRFILKIAKADADKVKLRFSVDGETREFSAAELMRCRTMAHAFPKCRVQWYHYRNLPDIAPRLHTDAAEFDTIVTSDRRYPILQMRAVTECGRIFRSDAVIPTPIPETTEVLNVFSESTGKVTAANVPSALIPTLTWRFSPEAGDMMLNDFDPYFRCDLGGGYVYGDGYHTLPIPPGRHAPVFAKDGERTVLKFDGSTYLHFPVETFPRGCFTLKFSIKPEPDENTSLYVLFRHFEALLGSVTVYAKFDRLCFAFGDRNLKTHRYSSALTLEPGKWSDVEIHYDLRRLTLNVNGQSASCELPAALALYFKPGIFGGHTKPEFGLPPGAAMFKGELRAISLEHR